MKPPAFNYAAPASIAEAGQLLASHAGEVKLIADGQSLMPMLNFRLLEPELLLDTSRLPGFDQITAGERDSRRCRCPLPYRYAVAGIVRTPVDHEADHTACSLYSDPKLRHNRR